eukprot:14179293-Ditylum_brightwellii.AAC.1
MEAWTKREKNMITDFAIVGWMLCVIPEVMEDIQQNNTSKYWLAVERIVSKLHAHLESEREIKMKVDKFWTKSTLFREKNSPFDMPHLWNSEGIQNSNSHPWQEKCQCTSKLLGIGLCKYSWDDVKQLKSGKQENLGNDAIEKQSVIHMMASIDEARIKQEETENIKEDGDG